MDVWTLVVILTRRWYVVLPVLVLTAVLGLQAERSVQATYSSDAAVIMNVPAEMVGEDGQPTETNPYLNFPSSLSVTANALVRIVGSQETRLDFASRGLLPTYEVGVDRGGPIVGWRVEGQDAEQVINTSDALRAELLTQLETLQEEAGAPDAQRIEGSLLGNPEAPTVFPGQATRTLVIVGGLGAALAASLAVLVDTLVRRGGRTRRGRRSGRTSAGDPDDVELPVAMVPDDLSREVEASLRQRVKVPGR